MKTLNNTRLDLRKFPKSVRQAIKTKKNEITGVLLEDLGTLFSKETISKDDFINLFEKHSKGIFANNLINIENITFKKDATPNLRSLPKSVREILRSFEKDAEQKKANDITKILANVEIITIDDLQSVLELSKEKPFQKKWKADSKLI
jgi:hypothetical protein